MTISLTAGEPATSSTVRMSGAASMAAAHQTDGPQTPTGIEEPAAVVSKSLERLNTALAESRTSAPILETDRGNGAKAAEAVAQEGLTEMIREKPGAFAERVQTEITTSAEIAVLAQAQQMPGGPMPFSGAV